MNIAIVLYPNFTALDAIGPMEVLSSVPGAKVQFVAEHVGILTNDTRTLPIEVTATLVDMPHPDILLVPGGPGCADAMKNEVLLDWLRVAHATTQWTTSVCTGSLVLGAAGLLQGLQATTHWGSWSDLTPLGATYAHERFVQQGKIITAAGVSAGIDMALWLASELRGEAVARRIQLLIEYDPAPPFAMPTPPTTHGEMTSEDMQVWEQRMGTAHSGDPALTPTSTQS